MTDRRRNGSKLILDEIFIKRGDIPEKVKMNAVLFLENGPRTYLTCFSREVDLLSQWTRYASNGSGFAIGFDDSLIATDGVPRDPFRSSGGVCEGMATVIYDKDKQVEILSGVLGDAGKP